MAQGLQRDTKHLYGKGLRRRRICLNLDGYGFCQKLSDAGRMGHLKAELVGKELMYVIIVLIRIR